MPWVRGAIRLVALGTVILTYAGIGKRLLAVEVESRKVSQETLSVCEVLVDRIKSASLERIVVAIGPFVNIFRQTIPAGCSFSARVKPDVNSLEEYFSRDWKSLHCYEADGPKDYACAWQNSQTVCFVSQDWDEWWDDVADGQSKGERPKPGSVLAGCTDKVLFQQFMKESSPSPQPSPTLGRGR